MKSRNKRNTRFTSGNSSRRDSSAMEPEERHETSRRGERMSHEDYNRNDNDMDYESNYERENDYGNYMDYDYEGTTFGAGRQRNRERALGGQSYYGGRSQYERQNDYDYGRNEDFNIDFDYEDEDDSFDSPRGYWEHHERGEGRGRAHMDREQRRDITREGYSSHGGRAYERDSDFYNERDRDERRDYAHERHEGSDFRRDRRQEGQGYYSPGGHAYERDSDFYIERDRDERRDYAHGRHDGSDSRSDRHLEEQGYSSHGGRAYELDSDFYNARDRDERTDYAHGRHEGFDSRSDRRIGERGKQGFASERRPIARRGELASHGGRSHDYDRNEYSQGSPSSHPRHSSSDRQEPGNYQDSYDRHFASRHESETGRKKSTSKGGKLPYALVHKKRRSISGKENH